MMSLLKFNKCFFILFLMITAGCLELVPPDYPVFVNYPTINSILVEGSPISIKVSLTGALDSTVLKNVDNATINLYIDDMFAEQLISTTDGFYYSKKKVESGREYQCKIFIPGYDTTFCSNTIPKPNSILNIQHINIAGRDEEGKIYHAFKVTFRNDLSARRYYEVVTNAGSYVAFTDPILLNEGLPIALFCNDMITDSVYTMTLNYSTGYTKIKDGHRILDPFVVELRSVTDDYYRYQKQYFLYCKGKYGDITTKTTAFPLYSNIENAYGIFAGYSVFVSDTIIPEPYDID